MTSLGNKTITHQYKYKSTWKYEIGLRSASFATSHITAQCPVRSAVVTQCCHYHDAVPCPAPSAAPPTVIGSVIDKMAQLENSNDAMCALLGWVWGVCSIYNIYNISTIYLQSLEYLLWGVEVKQQAAATSLECPAWVEDDGDPHLFLFLFYDRGKDTGWAGLGWPGLAWAGHMPPSYSVPGHDGDTRHQWPHTGTIVR